jgi:hypothetical protein
MRRFGLKSVAHEPRLSVPNHRGNEIRISKVGLTVVTSLQSLLSTMNLDEDLGRAVVPNDDESPASLSPTHRGWFHLQQRGGQEKVAVVVGKVLSPSPNLPRCRIDTEQQVGVGVGATAAANEIVHSDSIPRKPYRGSSERAVWSSHLGTGSGRRCDPQQASRATSPRDFLGKFKGSPLLPIIEVAPGIELRLRGSQETWEAIARDFYVPGLCLGCSETIFVIQDAAYLLCPTCRTVSPMDGTFERPEISGVGLGFTFEELVLWQHQIADEQSRNKYK